MGRGDQHQPELAVQHVPPGDRRDACAQVRPHHQHLVDQRPERADGADQLFRGQGRRARLHQGAGAGERPQRHHRQRDLPGLHRHRHGEGHAEGGAGEECAAADPDRPPRRARGDRALRCLSRLRRCGPDHRLDPYGERRAVYRLSLSSGYNMAATTPATTDLRPLPSVAVHWVKNNVLAAILAGIMSVCIYGVRQMTGAADGSAGSGAVAVLQVAAIVIWGLWGAASGVLTGAVLQRIIPRLPVWAWIALHAAGAAIVGVGLEMLLLSVPRDPSVADDASVGATLLLGLMTGAILGGVAGAAEAFVLRRVAVGTAIWVACSALGYAASWSFLVLSSSLLGLGTDFASELASDVLGVIGTFLMALIMLPALKRLRSSGLSAAARHFS